MGPISLILAVILVGSQGLPQLEPPFQDDSPPSAPARPPATLVSPWSQWMDLKAPPIATALPKKKKLLPGPPPPEGTPEAPWVSWTRMKVSSALAPPAPPPSPVAEATNSSSPQAIPASVWEQWTQMKLPLISPSIAPKPSSGATPETPWDAWMKVRTSMAAPAAVATGNAPAPVKRMAPDRYSIASTVAPRLPLWPPQTQKKSTGSTNSPSTSASSSSSLIPQLTRVASASSSSSSSSSSSLPSLIGSSVRPTYLDFLGSLTTPNVSSRLPYSMGSSIAQVPRPPSPFTPAGNFQTIGTQSPPLSQYAALQKPPQISRPNTVKEKPGIKLPLQTPSPAMALRPIPHQIVEEILAKGTAQEISSVVHAVAKAEEALSTTPAPGNSQVPSEIPVITLLPPSLVPKFTPELRPLLSKPIEISPSTTLLATKPVGAVSVPMSILPEAIREPILEKATPQELDTLLETLSKIEALPPSEQGLIAQLDVEAVLPNTLVPKLPEAAKSLLDSKLTPPVLQASLPKPVLDAILKAKPTSAEVELLVTNVAEVEKVAPTVNVPPPPLAVLMPSTLAAKLPPNMASILAKPLAPASKPPVTTSPVAANVLSSLPPPVLNDILIKATPRELSELVGILSVLQAEVPSKTPSIGSMLPSTLITKLSPEVKPLLGQPLVLPPISVLATIPEPVLKVVLQVATLEDLAQIAEKIEAAQDEQMPVQKSVAALLPSDLLAKIPSQIAPVVSQPVLIPPKVSMQPTKTAIALEPSTIQTTKLSVLSSVLSTVPVPVAQAIITKATSDELTQLSETITKLEALPMSEKPLVSKVNVVAIIPPSLLSKLPPSIVEELNIPVVLSPTPPENTSLPEPSEVSPIAGKHPLPAPTLISVLPGAPPPVLPTVMAIATPEELTELSSTIEKLEALSPAEKALVSQVTLETIIPSSLLEKIPPSVFPSLATPIILPSTPAEPVPTEISMAQPTMPAVLPVVPGVPPSILPPVVSVLSEAPPPVLPTVMTTATSEELSELAETIKKLQELPESEKPFVSNVILESILPPTLAAKIPADALPLFNTPVVLPTTTTTESTQSPITLPTTQKPVSSIPVPPVLKVIPEPVLGSVLTVANPSEFNQLVETLSELESKVSTETSPVPNLPLLSVLPSTLVPKLPANVFPLLSEPVDFSLSTSKPPPTPGSTKILTPITPEEKLLVKWAKKILLQTGKSSSPLPDEFPPLQAAWLEWVQLKMNETTPKSTSSISPESTTQYPWTKWLKLKSNTSTEAEATPPQTSSEEVVSEWLASLGSTTTPASPVEEKLAEKLKELGIENVNLPPEQIAALLATMEKVPEQPATPAVYAPLPSPFANSPPPMATYPPYFPVKPSPFIRPYTPFAYFPSWLSPPPEFIPVTPATAPETSTASATTSLSPAINLTEYLIEHKLIPPETLPTASIPISTLAKILEDEAAMSSEASVEETTSETTERSLMASELASLTPTKFAALLKQILKDCNRTVSHLSTRSSHSSKKGKGKGAISPIGAYYKNKYAKFKGPWANKFNTRALYPIPNQGVALPPTTSSPLLEETLPLPKVNTTGTIMDPAFWAAQKSMFLSKLFATLAKVALNDTKSEASTSSPKDQLSKQVNKVLLGDMTRSVKESSSEEEDSSSEESGSQENSDEVNEKKLVLEDGSEPSNVPKEPSNPLHKLFKFGVQKSVLSDLSSTTLPPTKTSSSSSISDEQEMIGRLRKALQKTKSSSASSAKKSKTNKSKSKSTPKKHRKSHHHHHHSKKKHSFRPTPPTTTTTENPVDFELLAKALLLDDNVGDPPKSQGGGGTRAIPNSD